METTQIIEQVSLQLLNTIVWGSLFSYVSYSIIRVLYLEEDN